MYADGSKGEESTHKDPENDDLSEAPSVKKPSKLIFFLT